MDVRQEEDRVPGGRIAAVAVVIGVVSAIYVLVAWGIDACRTESLGPGGAAVPVQVPEEVNAMETTLFDDTSPSELDHARERDRLGRFGWVDAEAGIAHVPIDVAIDMYLELHGVEAAGGAR